MKTYEQFIKESLKAAMAAAVLYHAYDLAKNHLKKAVKARVELIKKRKPVEKNTHK